MQVLDFAKFLFWVCKISNYSLLQNTPTILTFLHNSKHQTFAKYKVKMFAKPSKFEFLKKCNILDFANCSFEFAKYHIFHFCKISLLLFFLFLHNSKLQNFANLQSNVSKTFKSFEKLESLKKCNILNFFTLYKQNLSLFRFTRCTASKTIARAYSL